MKPTWLKLKQSTIDDLQAAYTYSKKRHDEEYEPGGTEESYEAITRVDVIEDLATRFEFFLHGFHEGMSSKLYWSTYSWIPKPRLCRYNKCNRELTENEDGICDFCKDRFKLS